jgi:hypothetical protein
MGGMFGAAIMTVTSATQIDCDTVVDVPDSTEAATASLFRAIFISNWSRHFYARGSVSTTARLFSATR